MDTSEKKDTYFERPDLIWWVLVISGMTNLYVVSFRDELVEGNWFFELVEKLGLFLFRSKPNLKLLFKLSALTHCGEGLYAGYLAFFRYKLTLSTMVSWFAQTAILGYPSLRLLLKLDNEKKKD
jgi:hypothetical protein